MKTLKHIRFCWYLFFLLIMLPPVKAQEKSLGFKFGIAWDDITQKDSYDHLANLGTDVIRLSGQNAAFWGLIEPKIGDGYKFASLDKVVGETYSKGIEIMSMILAIHPTEEKRTPVNYDAFNKFVKAVVERYDGDGYNDAPGSPIVKYWQVDNEPNGGGWNDTPENYAKLVKNTYEAAKEANNDYKIVLGGAMAGEPNADWEGFYETVLQELKRINPDKEFFDMVDFHYYREAFGDYRNIKDIFLEFNSLLEKYGYYNKGFVITETGTHSGEPVAGLFAGRYQSEKDQARDLLKRYVLSMSLGIKQVHWFRLKEKGSDFGSPNGREGNVFSLVPLIFNGLSAYDPGDGIKKLAYYTYKKMVEMLEGSDWKNIAIVQEQNGIYIYKFTKQGKPIWVAWNDSSVTRTITITISGISSNRVRATEAVPKYESGKDVADYMTAFQTDTLVVTNGAVMLALGQRPVFVEAFTLTSVEKEDENIPKEFVLYQNYPNPFNPTTTIRFRIADWGLRNENESAIENRKSKISLKVFDVLGREVATLVEGELNPGEHSVQFNAERLPSGIYCYRLSSETFIQQKKMVVMR